jgi:type I restriction enzyme R subunit
MATGNWKKMHGLHPEIRDLLRKLLMPLAGWERSAARDHASRILDILPKEGEILGYGHLYSLWK